MTIMVQSDYIHYIYNSYNGGASLYSSITDAKEEVAKYFLANVTKASSGGKVSPTEEQMKNLLDQMSSGKVIGDVLVESLNEIGFDSEGKSNIATGSNVFFNVESFEPPDIPDEAVRLLNQINTALNGIIATMKECNQFVIISQLKRLQNGQFVKGANVSGLFDSQMLSLASYDLEGAAAKLQENMALLENGESLSAKDLKSILASVRGSFNKIGGTLYEAVAVQAGNVAGKKIKERFAAANREIASMPNVKLIPDMRFTSSGAEKINGKSQKSDIIMTYNEGGVTFQLGGSIKLQQKTDVVKGKALPKISNLHSGLSIGDMIEEYSKISGFSLSELEHFEAGIGALKVRSGNKLVKFTQAQSSGGYSNLSTAWENLKEASKYAGFLRAISGSGANTGLSTLKNDTAAIIVVNNQVYSIYNILQSIVMDFDKYAKITGPGWTNSKFSTWHQKILASQSKPAEEGGPNYAETRSENIKGWIQQLYNLKVNISLNFAGLGI